MTKAMQSVLSRVSRLPEKRQDEIAGMLDRLIGSEQASTALAASDWAEIDRRLAAEPRYASDEDIEAFFSSADA